MVARSLLRRLAKLEAAYAPPEEEPQRQFTPEEVAASQEEERAYIAERYACGDWPAPILERPAGYP